MIRNILFLVITVFAFMGQAHAEKPDEIYKSCRLTGYFDGAKDNLYADLAARLSTAKGIKKDATCDASYDAGYTAGEAVKKNAKLKSDADKKIQSEASEFKKRIQDAMLHAAGLV
ncbi:MAG: hypothetical protein V4493_02880 [Pseudomonadota bacterium]